MREFCREERTMSPGIWLPRSGLGCSSNQEATVAFENKPSVVKCSRSFFAAPTKWQRVLVLV